MLPAKEAHEITEAIPKKLWRQSAVELINVDNKALVPNMEGFKKEEMIVAVNAIYAIA